MAQQLNKSRSQTIGGRFGLDPVGDMFIADPAEAADKEDERIKREAAAFDKKGLNTQNESTLAQKEKKQRSGKPVASGLQSSDTTTTSLLR